MKVTPFTWLAFGFFGYFCAYGFFVPFFPVWLKSQSYDEELIGLILAASYLFRFIGGIYFSALIKKASQLLNALRLFAWAGVLLTFAMGMFAEHFWLLFAAIALLAMVNSAGIPLNDTLATTWQHQVHLDYGKARLIGSAAFAVGVTVFGNMIGFVGEKNIIWLLCALFLLYALLQVTIPTIPPRDEKTDDPTDAQKALSKNVNSPTFVELLKNMTTLRLLIAISLIHGSHAVYYGYSVLYWTGFGISVQTTSLLWGLSVIAEMCLFFVATKFFKHWNVSSLFYLSAVAAVIRWLGFGFSDELWLIAVLQTFHSLTFAVSHYALVRYISTQPANAVPKLQGLYNGFASCAAVALFTGIGSMIYPTSPSAAFLTMAFFAALALFMIPRKVEAFLIKRN